jgi:glycosyltransferase involved in cell wall biosynthesis
LVVVLEIDYINGRRTDQVFGISKYNSEIFSRIKGVHLNKIEYPQIGTYRLIDGAVKRTIYPMIVKYQVHDTVVKHVTNQDLAFLLTLIDLHPSIVTCHDLIPVAYSIKHSLYWKMNLRGLRKADHIITISEFSKKEIIRLTGITGGRISVIHGGVDTAKYFPKRDRSILLQYSITDRDNVIMYLGSEEPRKNIALILNAIHQLKKTLPNIKFLKVGGTQMGGDRRSLIGLIRKLNLENEVLFTGQVPEADLPKYYNAADIFVFPSYYEGFGLPPLEAMACGCPVITANTTSLPEVIGDAGILVEPNDVEGLANQIYAILSTETIREELVKNGVIRAELFTWENAANLTLDLYNSFTDRSDF